MYVSYETYADTVYGDGVSEAEYPAYSALADVMIDDWTYGRVGKAVEDGEELPQDVILLYSAIVSNGKSLKESTTNSEAALSSFSNGVDSYGFDTDKSVSERLYSSLAWMLDALPVRWTSAVANQRPTRCWHG